MTSILDAVRQQLGPNTIQQMSGALGADAAATSDAVSLALPAILTGLSQNASQPQGAAALDTALNAHDGSILDNLGGVLGGGEVSVAPFSGTSSGAAAARWSRRSVTGQV